MSAIGTQLVLTGLLAGFTGMVIWAVVSMRREKTQGLHLHAGGVLHSHRAGWKPHAHPTWTERYDARLARIFREKKRTAPGVDIRDLGQVHEH